MALCSLEILYSIVQIYEDLKNKMLVLALQFSRGDVDACGARNELDAAASVRACFHSLKTEEKTVAAGVVTRGRDRIPDNLEVVTSTAHQCTNRCVSSWIVRMTMLQSRSTP